MLHQTYVAKTRIWVEHLRKHAEKNHSARWEIMQQQQHVQNARKSINEYARANSYKYLKAERANDIGEMEGKKGFICNDDDDKLTMPHRLWRWWQQQHGGGNVY